LAKLICVGEIITGCLLLVFGVNLAMRVWVQKFGVTNGSDTHKKI